MGAPRLPHPVPYQGSKRRLAARILATVGGARYETLHEPFAGSAAVTIAAAAAGTARRFVLGDALEPLVGLWSRALEEPDALADEYERLWRAGDYLGARATFNASGGTAELLYLLARCVKNSPRFNTAGAFNQSADRRRRGMRPDAMRAQLTGAAELLGGRAVARHRDFAAALADAGPGDLVYLDPPWEGTSTGADRRYREGLDRERLIAALEDLDARGVPYLLSYDGRHGAKRYGSWLPPSIGATRLELDAGRSSQATLHGRAVTTVESLYVSRHLGAARAAA